MSTMKRWRFRSRASRLEDASLPERRSNTTLLPDTPSTARGVRAACGREASRDDTNSKIVLARMPIP